MAREREEGVRALYVAATRARDLLVVPVLADERIEGWLEPLDPAVYPEEPGMPESIEPAGCPSLEGEGVWGVPDNARRGPLPVRPGLHRPRQGGHRVVWWEPRLLGLEVDEDVGLRQQKLLTVDERGQRSEAGIVAHAAWQAERAQVRAAGAMPLVRVVTATEHALATKGEEDVVIEDAAWRGDRPHGARFGTLVHAVLATVALDADRAQVAATAVLQGRILGAAPPEVTAATEIAAHALGHPLLRRAAAAEACRRETAVLERLDDGTVVEGVVDAAFADADGWTVIDFKTDAELGARAAVYRRQVALYARAIAQATGRPARGVLLRV